MLKVLSRLVVAIILVSAGAAVVHRHAAAQTACSVQEQQLIAAVYQQTMVAAMNGDFQRIAQLSQQLDRSLSPRCKAALAAAQSGGGQGQGGRYSAECSRARSYYQSCKRGQVRDIQSGGGVRPCPRPPTRCG